MDTLSASVSSSFNLPSLPPQPQPPLKSISHRFKPTANATAASSTNLSRPPTSSSSPSSYSQQNKNPNFLSGISFHAKPGSRASPPVHDKAASGFAAALVSVCQSKNCLGKTQEDVRRLMEFLFGEEKKRNKGLLLVNEVVVERGKFGKHLKGLAKMLIAKGKSGILFDVLMEFERICNELVLVRTTKSVWV